MRLLLAHGDTRSPEQGQGGGGESLCHDTIQAMTRRGHDVFWWHYQKPISQVVDEFKPHAAWCSTLVVGLTPNGHGIHDTRTMPYLASRVPTVLQLNDYWPFCESRMCLIEGDTACAAVTGECDQICGQQHPPYSGMVASVPTVALNCYSADIFRRNGIRIDHVWELGVDEQRFKPGTKHDDPVIVTSSAWAAYPTKGMHILKKACHGRDWGVGLMTGLPRSKVAEVLADADIYVFPSCYEETWGLCLTEAMASGCACVASDVAGAKAQIEHGYNGLIVRKRDPQALAEAIDQLIADRCLRRTLGGNARATVEERFTLQHMAARMEAILEEVVRNGST